MDEPLFALLLMLQNTLIVTPLHVSKEDKCRDHVPALRFERLQKPVLQRE